MASLDSVVKKMESNPAAPLDRLCEVKSYLKIEDKIKFLKEFKELVEEHVDDYPEYKPLVSIVFFELMLVKKYTNIDLDMNYDEYDKIQECGLMSKITEKIEQDYAVLLDMLGMVEKKES